MRIDAFTVTDDGWVLAPDGTRLRAISGGGGGGKTTVVNQTNVPPRTPEETELLREQLNATKTQNQLFQVQIEEVKKQNAEFEKLLPAQRELFAAQTGALTSLARVQEQQFEAQARLLPVQERQVALLEAALTETPTQTKIREASEARALAFLEGRTPPLSAGQTERLDTLFGTQREEGQEEIRRFAEELAGQRGLNLSDTPIGGEALRATERLERGLRGARAAAEIDITQAETLFSEQTRQFQAGLSQQAFMNRLALTGAAPGGNLPPSFGGRGALPLSSTGGMLGPADSTGLLNVLTQERIASAPTRSTSRYTPGFFDYFSTVLGALGGAAGGFAGAAAASSITLKKDVLPLDMDEFAQAATRRGRVLDMEPADEYEKARQTVRGLPIARWRYKHEPETRTPHIGVIAELSPDEIREGPLKINLMDLAGLTLAAVKGVDRRVDRLERRGLPVEVGR